MANPNKTYRLSRSWVKIFTESLDRIGYCCTKEKAFKDGSIGRILLVRLDDIGDVLLATPVIRNLKEAFPDASLDMLVKSSTAEIVENHPCVDRIWTLEPFWMRTAKPSRPSVIWDLVHYLRQQRYDLALELRGNPFNILLVALSGSRWRVGFGAQGLGFLLTSVVPYDVSAKHEIERNLDLLRALELPVHFNKPELFLSDTARLEAEDFLFKHNLLQQSPIVCIHPGAPWLPRRWPQERFVLLVDTLVERYLAGIVLIGSHSEAGLCAAIRELVSSKNRDQVAVASGLLSLSGSAALIERANLFIGNDSGPMHIAQALGTETIALFGPQTPDSFGPYQSSATAIYKKVPCSPCVQKAGRGCARGFACCQGLLEISHEDVFNLIERSALGRGFLSQYAPKH